MADLVRRVMENIFMPLTVGGGIRTLDDAAIRKALGDIELEQHADDLPPLEASAQSGEDFGWPVMLCVLGFLVAEAFMAMRFGHYRRS
jgi:imidazole glycerol phosphate synthase subunit HisF